MASWAAEEVTPDPKPERRHKATAKEWETIREQFTDACCVACGMRYESLHHIVPRGQGGDDTVENLAPLCGDGARGCHGIFEGHAPGWQRVAVAIRQYVILNRPRCVYVVGKIGWDRLNARYPLLAAHVEAEVEPVWRTRPPDVFEPREAEDWL